jgi:hypothetical protein
VRVPVWYMPTVLSILNFGCILHVMPAKGKTPLTLNIDPDLLARIDKYRFRRMFPTRTEAIEFLLDAGLKLNPERTEPAPKRAKGE